MLALLIGAVVVYFIASYGAKDKQETEQNVKYLAFFACAILAPFGLAMLVK